MMSAAAAEGAAGRRCRKLWDCATSGENSASSNFLSQLELRCDHQRTRSSRECGKTYDQRQCNAIFDLD